MFFLGVIGLTTPATYYKGIIKHTRCTFISVVQNCTFDSLLPHQLTYFPQHLNSTLGFRKVHLVWIATEEWSKLCAIVSIVSVWQCQIKLQAMTQSMSGKIAGRTASGSIFHFPIQKYEMIISFQCDLMFSNCVELLLRPIKDIFKGI